MIYLKVIDPYNEPNEDMIVLEGQSEHVPRYDDEIKLPDGSIRRVMDNRWLPADRGGTLGWVVEVELQVPK